MGKQILFIFLIFIFVGCNPVYNPKPYGYLRIELPPRDSIQQFNLPEYPYVFGFPAYGVIAPSTDWYKEPYWINISIPKHKATIHISYKPIHNNLAQLTEDVHKLTYQHSYRAEAITEQVFRNPQNHVYGVLYTVEGEVASATQFYVTDSVKHFLRGALYFKTKINRDSLQPLIQHFTHDIQYMTNTIRWKTPKKSYK